MSIHLHIVCGYFVLWWQSWAVPRLYCLKALKYLLSSPSQKKKKIANLGSKENNRVWRYILSEPTLVPSDDNTG